MSENATMMSTAGPMEETSTISQLNSVVRRVKTGLWDSFPKSSMLNPRRARFITQHRIGMSHCPDRTLTRYTKKVWNRRLESRDPVVGEYLNSNSDQGVEKYGEDQWKWGSENVLGLAIESNRDNIHLKYKSSKHKPNQDISPPTACQQTIV